MGYSPGYCWWLWNPVGSWNPMIYHGFSFIPWWLFGISEASTAVSGIHLFLLWTDVAFCQGTPTRCEACRKAGPLFHSWTCCNLKWFEDPKSESNIYIWSLKTVKTFKIKKKMSVFCGLPYPKTPRTTGHSIENFEWLLFMVGTWLIRQEMKEMRVIWDQEQAGQDCNNPLTLRSK